MHNWVFSMGIADNTIDDLKRRIVVQRCQSDKKELLRNKCERVDELKLSQTSLITFLFIFILLADLKSLSAYFVQLQFSLDTALTHLSEF